MTKRSWWVIPAAFTVALPGTSSAQAPITVEEARAQLAARARDGGYWATSNERYWTPEGGEPKEYRMSFTLSPDGLTMAGCMWNDVDAADANVFWRFFSGWDPTEGMIIAYQASPWGAVAVGHHGGGPDGTTETVQVLGLPDGTETRIRHLGRFSDEDTMESRSFDGTADGWAPRREYTWVWRETEAATPC